MGEARVARTGCLSGLKDPGSSFVAGLTELIASAGLGRRFWGVGPGGQSGERTVFMALREEDTLVTESRKVLGAAIAARKTRDV